MTHCKRTPGKNVSESFRTEGQNEKKSVRFSLLNNLRIYIHYFNAKQCNILVLMLLVSLWSKTDNYSQNAYLYALYVYQKQYSNSIKMLYAVSSFR